MPGKIVQADEGLPNAAFALPRVFKVLGTDSDGAFATWAETVPPGAGPPLHVHRREHEQFVVLSGKLTFQCDGQRGEVGPGGVVLVPAGSPHTFRNFGTDPAVTMVTLTPGGGEGFFLETADLSPETDMERILAIADRFGMDFVGPPLEP